MNGMKKVGDNQARCFVCGCGMEHGHDTAKGDYDTCDDCKVTVWNHIIHTGCVV